LIQIELQQKSAAIFFAKIQQKICLQRIKSGQAIINFLQIELQQKSPSTFTKLTNDYSNKK
jgi:hypothetical protein